MEEEEEEETLTQTLTINITSEFEEIEYSDENETVESVCSPITEYEPFFESPQTLSPNIDVRKKKLMEEIRGLSETYRKKLQEYVDIFKYNIGEDEFLEQQSELLKNHLNLIDLWKLPSKASKFRNYVIVSQIGRGGSSEVFKVKHRYLDVYRAAKVFKRSQEKVLDTFAIEEAKRVVGLSNHQNIVKVFDLDFITTQLTSGVNEKRCIIIMELVEMTLKSWILQFEKCKKKIGLDEYFKIIGDVLVGLRYIHSNQIIHLDIKPSNIGIQINHENGFPEIANCKILDFGISTKLGENGKRVGGSKGFIAPEIIEDPRNVSFQSDIFSIGMVMKRMLSGYTEFEIPLEIRSIISKCCKVDRKQRYKSIGELMDDFSFCVIYSCGSALSKIRSKLMSNWFYQTKFPIIYEKNYNGFRRDQIIIEYLNNSKELDTTVPNEYEDEYLLNLEKWKEKLRKNEVWNNTMIAIKLVFPIRFGEDEEVGMKLVISRTNVLHLKTMNDVYLSLSENSRDKILRTRNPLFLNQSSVHITLITSDYKMLFCVRGKNVAIGKGQYTCGIVESCDKKDLDEFGIPDYFRCAIRGIDEELGIFCSHEERELAESRVKLTGLMCTSSMEVGFVGYLDLRGMEKKITNSTSLGIQKLLETSFGKDCWENEKCEWVDLDITRVIGFLKKNKTSLSQSGLCCAVFTLKSIFEQELVDQVLLRDLTSSSSRAVMKKIKY